MVHSPKRTASRSPENERPAKRLATSSPEEGELDDTTPTKQIQSSQRSPSPPKFQPKVKFPFKKKSEQSNGGDHWEPSHDHYGYQRDSDRNRPRPTRWDDFRGDRRERRGDRKSDWNHPLPPVSKDELRQTRWDDVRGSDRRDMRGDERSDWNPPVSKDEPRQTRWDNVRGGERRDMRGDSKLDWNHPPPSANNGDEKRGREKKDATVSSKQQDYVANAALPLRKKREPVQQSRKEELEIYGRVFEGCGQQRDYDATTKLGEGTFGEVHKAVHLVTSRSVALKRILMHNEKEGMPVTALREIKILKAMNHPCVVDILDMFVVRSKGKDSTLSVYMVFPYMDHDLAGLLENERVKLQPSQIKLYMKQLLEGTEYMHRNHILHRDMKAANLLISNTGSLRIADFGLARTYDPSIVRGGDQRKYTNCVVTRWYRPPELLLGARQYGGEVDIWGIGCVLGEMFMRKPILPGTSDVDQLEKIWQLCGTPNQHTWPNHDALPGCEGIKRFNTTYSKKLRSAYESIGAETCDLLDKLLTCNPRERISAAQALDHDYFWTDPLPADPKLLPSYEASHEFDRRGRHNQMHAAQMMAQQDTHHRPPMQPTAQPPPSFFNRGPREAFRGPPPPPIPAGGFPPKPPPPPNRPAHYPYPGPYLGSHNRTNHPSSGPLINRPHHVADRWEPPRERPAHLPPRPPAPLGTGVPPAFPTHNRDRNHRRGGYGGGGGGPGGLNYG